MYHQNNDFIIDNQASDFQQSGNHLSTLDSAATNVGCHPSHYEIQPYQSSVMTHQQNMSLPEHVNQPEFGSTNDLEGAVLLNSKSLGRNRSISNESFSTSTSSEIGYLE